MNEVMSAVLAATFVAKSVAAKLLPKILPYLLTIPIKTTQRLPHYTSECQKIIYGKGLHRFFSKLCSEQNQIILPWYDNILRILSNNLP